MTLALECIGAKDAEGLATMYSDITSSTPLTRRQAIDAVSRLVGNGVVARHRLDGNGEVVVYLSGRRDSVLVDQPFRLSPNVSLLYSAFGISAPSVIRRGISSRRSLWGEDPDDDGEDLDFEESA